MSPRTDTGERRGAPRRGWHERWRRPAAVPTSSSRSTAATSTAPSRPPWCAASRRSRAERGPTWSSTATRTWSGVWSTAGPPSSPRRWATCSSTSRCGRRSCPTSCEWTYGRVPLWRRPWTPCSSRTTCRGPPSGWWPTQRPAGRPGSRLRPPHYWCPPVRWRGPVPARPSPGRCACRRVPSPASLPAGGRPQLTAARRPPGRTSCGRGPSRTWTPRRTPQERTCGRSAAVATSRRTPRAPDASGHGCSAVPSAPWTSSPAPGTASS